MRLQDLVLMMLSACQMGELLWRVKGSSWRWRRLRNWAAARARRLYRCVIVGERKDTCKDVERMGRATVEAGAWKACVRRHKGRNLCPKLTTIPKRPMARTKSSNSATISYKVVSHCL